MTTIYSNEVFNNNITRNPYNLVNINSPKYNFSPPQVSPTNYTNLTYNAPKNLFKKPQNISPFILEDNNLPQKLNQNSPQIANIYNINTLNVNNLPRYNYPYYNQNQALYQTSSVNNNNIFSNKLFFNHVLNEDRHPRFIQRQQNAHNYNTYMPNNNQPIQRANTVNIIPRPSAAPRIGSNFYFKYGNSHNTYNDNNYTNQNLERKTFSNDNKYNQNNFQQRNKVQNMNNINVVNNGNNPLRNNIQHLNYLTDPYMINAQKMENLYKVTKIQNNIQTIKNNQQQINNEKQSINEQKINSQPQMNINRQINNGNHTISNELNKNQQLINLAKVTKITSNNLNNINKINSMNNVNNIKNEIPQLKNDNPPTNNFNFTNSDQLNNNQTFSNNNQIFVNNNQIFGKNNQTLDNNNQVFGNNNQAFGNNNFQSTNNNIILNNEEFNKQFKNNTQMPQVNQISNNININNNENNNTNILNNANTNANIQNNANIQDDTKTTPTNMQNITNIQNITNAQNITNVQNNTNFQMNALKNNPQIDNTRAQFSNSVHLPNTVQHLNQMYNNNDTNNDFRLSFNKKTNPQLNPLINNNEINNENNKSSLNQNNNISNNNNNNNLNNNSLNNNFNLNNNNNSNNINNVNNNNTSNTNNENNENNSNNITPQAQTSQEPVVPFSNNNGEIISNIKCHEYFRQTNTSPVTSYGYSQNQNASHRSYMEDEGRVIENLNGDPNKILFLLFDGHGGGQVSKFLQEHFHEYIKKMLPFNDYFLGFTKLFRVIDEDVKKLNCPNTGATGTAVFIEKDKDSNIRTLYCANVGDSRCVLVNKKGTMRMSYDDRVADQKESQRIMNSGGIIFQGRVYGQLMLSRSFGDWSLKTYGVIVDPHVTKIVLNEDDLYCVIASDGIWDVIKDEDCMALANMKLNTGELSKCVLNESLKRGTLDNLSCFVISLN